MKWNKLTGIVLAAALTVTGTACAAKGGEEAPAETASAFASKPQAAASSGSEAEVSSAPEAEGNTVETGRFESEGLILNVPETLRDIVVVETSRDDTLFFASEKTSVEEAAADGQSAEDGWGWLFDIRRIDQETFYSLQMADLSGIDIFAKDAEGMYYILDHPTDVRIFRKDIETLEPEDETFSTWTLANEWAFDVAEQFTADNGLEAVQVSNTEADIFLANLAYDEEAKVELVNSKASTDVSGTEALTEAVQRLTAGGTFEAEVREKAPEGASLTVKLTSAVAGDLRLDVFASDPTLLRVSYGNDVEYGQYFRSSFEDGTRVYDVIQTLFDRSGMGK